ncbi:MAG: hypothetical protein HUK06_09960, partial [Bacteroidaceae bacterium]|nr:hypothetical protein [Bacteroidaceae bacterium]
MVQDDKLRVLYDALNNQYNLGSFDEFKTKMQDETKRKAFYDGVSNAYDLGSFDEFNGKIASSFVKPKSTAQPTAPKQSAVATVGGTAVKGVQQTQEEQPKWTPTPVQRMGIQMQMDDIQRRAKQSVDGFNETMKNMQSVNPLTMQSKPRVQFNASTGKMETTYGSLDGKSYT